VENDPSLAEKQIRFKNQTLKSFENE